MKFIRFTPIMDVQRHIRCRHGYLRHCHMRAKAVSAPTDIAFACGARAQRSRYAQSAAKALPAATFMQRDADHHADDVLASDTTPRRYRYDQPDDQHYYTLCAGVFGASRKERRACACARKSAKRGANQKKKAWMRLRRASVRYAPCARVRARSGSVKAMRGVVNPRVRVRRAAARAPRAPVARACGVRNRVKCGREGAARWKGRCAAAWRCARF